MPVVQISRIQHRRGLSTDLPQPNLAEGELGLTLDTGELFIGSPNFPPISGRSSYPYQNLRVLTEFSLRDLSSTLTYAYRLQDPDDAAFPGVGSYQAEPASVVERFLQERLDEIVSVKSYGAKGNGVDSDDTAITNACIDIYTDSYKDADPKILYFPAGVYLINEASLPLVEGTRWVGDGKGRTIIYLDNGSVTHNNLNYITSVVETAEWDGATFNTNANIDNPVLNIFVSGITFARSNVGDILHLNRSAKATFVDTSFKVATLTAGALVKNIEWYTNEFHALGAAARAAAWPSSVRYNVKEHGICVRIDRLSSLNNDLTDSYEDISDDFLFLDCDFDSNTYGFYVVDSINNVNVVSSKFHDLYKGVSLGEAIYYDSVDFLETNTGIGDLTVSLPFDPNTSDVALTGTYKDWDPTGQYSPILNPVGSWGPQGFRVSNCSFKNILNTPFSVFSNRFGNTSINNTYTLYGQGIMSDASSVPGSPTQISPAVFFFRETANTPGYGPSGVGTGDINVYLAENNTSANDMFDYTGTDSILRVHASSLRNLVSNPQTPLNVPTGITSGIMYQSPMEPEAVQLASGGSAETVITFDAAVYNAIIVDYSIVRGTGFKKGQLHIVSNSSDVDWYENVVEVGAATNISIDVVYSAGDILVQFTDDTGGTDVNVGSMHYSYRAWDQSFTDYNA